MSDSPPLNVGQIEFLKAHSYLSHGGSMNVYSTPRCALFARWGHTCRSEQAFRYEIPEDLEFEILMEKPRRNIRHFAATVCTVTHPIGSSPRENLRSVKLLKIFCVILLVSPLFVLNLPPVQG